MKTQGTDLYAIDPRDDSLIDVGCVTSLDGIDSSIDQIETTCLNSAERTYVAGLGTPGTATYGINIDTADENHIKLFEIKQLGLTLNWAVGMSDGARDAEGNSLVPPTVDSGGDFNLPAARSWITFQGFMNSFPFSFALNGVVASTVGIQVSGAQALIPKTA
jgi:hypothetical protein